MCLVEKLENVTLEEAYKLYEAGFKVERDDRNSELLNVTREGE